MHRILLVHNERYLDRALHDVLHLARFDRQLARQGEDLDLLAVILTPLSGDAHIASQAQTCELGYLATDAQIFDRQSVSVNGIWSLLTVSPSVMQNSMKREEVLSRILNVLEGNEGVRKIGAVVPVFPPDETQDAIAEQIEYLKSQHQSIPMISPLARRSC